jgi:hypothetical protein
MDGSHCQIVANTLAGDRPVDEHTFASVAVLTERLERLKGQGEFFAGVEFSPHVQQLKQHSEPLSVA